MGEESRMETPRRYPLIFNPKARSEKAGKMRRFLTGHGHRFEVIPTRHAGDARELAARLAAQGESVVIAAGGDGTLNEVAAGLVGTATVLGVLPVGTMNVFARELGIPFDSLERAFAVIERGFVRKVDVFAANGIPFLQMAGMGFDAAVIEETSLKSKKLIGPLAYLFAAFKVMRQAPAELTVVCADGRREQGVAVLVGNGGFYAGPFRFFRKADNQDSKLDVLVYKKAGCRLLLDSLRGLARGGIDMLDSTTYFQTESLSVQATHEVPVEVDGEWIGRFAEVNFAETANHLHVIAPEGVACAVPSSWKSLLPWRGHPAEIPTTPVP